MRQLSTTLLPVSRLQTNEVRRCANLLPAFELVFQRGGGQPLALIEIGTSAGLNLNWFRYGYRYGEQIIGNPLSPVQISCELSGRTQPPLPRTLPRVAHCQGIEVCPLDVTNERDLRWLRSCIWPEERERYHLLDAAVTLAHQHPPQVVQGDACEHLPEILAAIPRNQTLCVWHSFALNQGPEAVREQILQALKEASQYRTIYRIALEAHPSDSGLPRLDLFLYRDGDLSRTERLAACDFHGETMEWFGS